GNAILLAGSSSKTLTGPVDLGSVGAQIGTKDVNTTGILTITGTVTGGMLTVNTGTSVNLSSTSNSFAGITFVAGTRSPQLQATLTSTAPITLGAGSTFVIDNSVSAANDRVPDAVPVTMRGAKLVFEGPVGVGVAASETLGTLAVPNGYNFIFVHGRGGTGNI